MVDLNKDYGYDYCDVYKFMDVFCIMLKLFLCFVILVYEDVVYYLWQEGNLLDGFDFLKKDLKLDLE